MAAAVVYGLFDTTTRGPFYNSVLVRAQEVYMQATPLPVNFLSPWEDEDHPENFIPGPEDQHQPQNNLESCEEEDHPENIPPPQERIQHSGHGNILQAHESDDYDDDDDDDYEFDDLHGQLVQLNNGEIVRLGDAFAVISEDLEVLGQRSNLYQEIISEHLQTRKYQKLAKQDEDQDEVDELCVICQDGFESEDMLGTLGCQHEFHADCITRWLQVKNVCPICKCMAIHHQGN
ncbi:E3 ubiquitin ligase BIG BROTHER-related-like [Coffea eugenioides]|uniref:E3 ubiquitin ligase BIG BROTHER-related-like n=1 Tax=Coffea eugenioides TaxID=49369 RepID=UPI000F613C3F|nr:E3 ubiquitin ligase BIG BROTHER-related-like [Coffea eugenioides]